MPELILSDIVLYLLSGLVLGFLIGLTGIGGGVLTVPFLLLVIKLEPIAAVGTAGLYGVLTKIWAAVRHYRQGTVNLDVGVRFFLAAVAGGHRRLAGGEMEPGLAVPERRRHAPGLRQLHGDVPPSPLRWWRCCSTTTGWTTVSSLPGEARW